MKKGEKQRLKEEQGKGKKEEEEDKQRYEKLKEEVSSIQKKNPKDDPMVCEGQIRALEKKISTFHDAQLKDELLHDLKSVSYLGLQEDLKTKMEENGLALEALTLVSKYLTTVPELAQHLYLNSKDVLKGEGLEIIKRRLGPGLEVLGGLKAKGIDVTKPWVKRLINKVPSLLSLSRLPAENLESLCMKSAESGGNSGESPAESGGESPAESVGKSTESPAESEEKSAETPAESEEKSAKSPAESPAESEGKSGEKTGEEASKEEMDVVRELAKVAKAYNRQTSALPPDLNLPLDNPDIKAIDEEKLRKAKELMKEAKDMADEQSEEAKKATKEKMAEMMKVLELPSDWCKQDAVTPEQLFKELDGIVDQYQNFVDVAESYKSDLEVTAKASGGRALCGINYSEYEPPLTAARPVILMPANITLTNPDNTIIIRYLKFSESSAAENYVHTVKSSNTNIGFSVAGFYGCFVGEVKGAYSSENQRDETRSVKSHTTSASVLQYIWNAKKCFRIDQEQMKLTESALRMAKSCVIASKARRFMAMFGSHFPAGVQTLGGVFFSTAEVESKEVQTTSTLTQAATQKLQGQISFGFLGGLFGIGGSVKVEHQSSSGKQEAHHEDDEKNSYTYNVHTMGPAAPNPAVFQKLLSYNSTWALIDRGSHQAYIPIWELLRDLGSDYEKAAQVLEKTWKEDEESKKEKSEELKKLYEKRSRKEDVRKELEQLRDEYKNREPEKDYGYWPSNGDFIYSAFKLSKEKAFDKAIELVMKDPHLNICEIYLRSDEFYALKCWKAEDDVEMTFDQDEGWHVLFYSEIAFKWRSKVPVREKCD